MAQQRPPVSREQDPFSGNFSQERVTPAAASWPVLQWHGGLASLVGDAETVKINGGFFIEDDRIAELGLDAAYPALGFERLALRLGGKQIPGWGAAMLHLAFIFTDFSWEDRETGRLRFPPTEYERRKQQVPGTERELRGRTRALVAVKELLDEGVVEPLVLSVRGSYSAALNAILRESKRMADEATRLRRRAGHDGSIPREAFWLPVYAGIMEDVGEGANTSRVALPKVDLPTDLNRDLLVQHLVEETHRRPGGTFDQWAQLYADSWQEKAAHGGGEEVDGYVPNGATFERYVEEPY
ncbi:MAG: hypothetical protein H0T73_10200 [Ardenticatenales bacterium]|nr:hypothetical protein [Ardenticatenales bacterium]